MTGYEASEKIKRVLKHAGRDRGICHECMSEEQKILEKISDKCHEGLMHELLSLDHFKDVTDHNPLQTKWAK
jgi:hypothetical protein